MLEQSDEADHGPGQDNTDGIGAASGYVEDEGSVRTLATRSTSATKGWFDRSLRALNTWLGGTLSAVSPPVENVATAARAAEVTGHSRASFVEPMPAKRIEHNRSGEAVAGSDGASGLSSMDDMEVNDETLALNNNAMQKQSDMMAVKPTIDDDWGDTAGAYQYPMNAAADGASVAAPGKKKGIGGGPSGIHPSSWTAWTSRFVKVNSDGTWELNQEAEKLSSKNRRKLLFKLNYKPRTNNMTDDDWDTM